MAVTGGPVVGFDAGHPARRVVGADNALGGHGVSSSSLVSHARVRIDNVLACGNGDAPLSHHASQPARIELFFLVWLIDSQRHKMRVHSETSHGLNGLARRARIASSSRMMANMHSSRSSRVCSPSGI